MRYFEIYVGGRNGFSVAVKTDKLTKPVGDVDEEENILSLAVEAKVIEPYDAKDVVAGAGYVEELDSTDEAEMANWPNPHLI